MKNLKFSLMLLLAANLLFGLGTVNKAVADNNTTVQGTAAKMTVFDNDMLTCFDVKFSANDKYLITNNESQGFVYELATGFITRYSGFTLIEYLDANNYVASDHVVINGTTYDAYNGLSSGYYLLDSEANWEIIGADSSCRYLIAYVYMNGRYGNVFVDVLANNGEGAVIDTLPFVFPDETTESLGCFMRNYNNDLSCIVGHSSHPSVALTNMSPVFWDRVNDTCFYIGDNLPQRQGGQTDGALHACNRAGNIMVGELADRPYYILYDRAGKTFTRIAVPLEAGMSKGYAYSLSEDGKILGMEQRIMDDMGSREGFLYNIHTGEKFNLAEYLYYLYGLDTRIDGMYSLAACAAISTNSRRIAGLSITATGDYVPFLVSMNAKQLHAPVRNLSMHQVYGSTNVAVSWKAPVAENYTVKGYNIYRGDAKINPQLIDAATLNFIDNNVEPGTPSYKVEAVYEDGETVMSGSESLIVTGDNDCLPVQDIRANVLYNKTVTVQWGLPSSKAPATGTSGKKQAEPEKGYVLGESTLDMADLHSTRDQVTSALVRIGDNYYGTRYSSASITVFDAYTFERKAVCHIDNAFGKVYDITCHDHTLYLVSGNQKVFEIDVDDTDPDHPVLTLSNYWETLLEKNINIAYVENDEGEDYLLVGGWYEIKAYPLNPADKNDTLPMPAQFEFPQGIIISGSEVHKGRLYLANQGAASGAGIEVFDMATGELLSSTDMYSYPQLFEASQYYYGYVGGLAKDVMDNGTVVLEALVQPYVESNLMVSIEIESAPDVVGYNLYRNEVKLNDEPLKVRHFVEDIDDQGYYKYTVEYVSTKCNSFSEDAGAFADVQIYAHGDCAPPANLAVMESNETAVLTWKAGEQTGGADLVGYNIYKNGNLIKEDLLDLKFHDPDIKKDTLYVYTVEAHYSNACLSVDEVSLTPTFEGLALPPTVVKSEAVKEKDDWKTVTTWDLPYFEKPMSIGYCNQPLGAFSLPNASQTYGLIGWGAKDMEQFEEDLYLVGMEFVIAAECEKYYGVVFVDDKQVYFEPISQRLQISNERNAVWNTVYFDRAFPMKQEKEIALGYCVFYNPDEVAGGTLVYDMGPADRGLGDICATDGSEFYFLKDNDIDANLCIRALVVRRRDLEAGKSVSASHTLQGFNIYRDGTKLNDQILSELRFEDSDVKPGGDYEYTVSAVYAQDGEKNSSPVFVEILEGEGIERAEWAALGLKLYPNPASAAVRITGRYENLTVMDMTGRVILDGVRAQESVSLEGWKQGLYIFRFTGEGGKTASIKVIKK